MHEPFTNSVVTNTVQCQELQQSLDYLRFEFQAALAAAEAKETQHKAEVEKMSHTIQFKENEITHLGETLRRRVKETADEWIQRVTSIMSQLTEQNQKSVEEFEICLQEIRTELHQTKEEIGRVVEERDAARNDIAKLVDFEQQRKILRMKLEEIKKSVNDALKSYLSHEHKNSRNSSAFRQEEENRRVLHKILEMEIDKYMPVFEKSGKKEIWQV
ncbi:hypothetical protein DAPPUDRAFT_322672 [Daphnia pulex]|uniref:Uncharacterized protein n=1 Tax=Daphnia pulex TaxID=6669 RepID=E9GWP3_DAPPU|nr:hypothetical protein DAPPUDRAFT_322672 [Daphnia pulex]|eukprot:EFX76143.1 hypothetical protein DAPPUDRAFT_322672 [Daphnia pulex]